MGRWVNKALSAELFEPETLVHLLWSITEEQMKENTNETQVSSHPSAASFIVLFLFSPFRFSSVASVNLLAQKKSLISRKCPLTYAPSNWGVSIATNPTEPVWESQQYLTLTIAGNQRPFPEESGAHGPNHPDMSFICFPCFVWKCVNQTKVS